MVVKDWVAEAAEQIILQGNEGSSPLFTIAATARIREIIREFCPFKQGVAYMEVLREHKEIVVENSTITVVRVAFPLR